MTIPYSLYGIPDIHSPKMSLSPRDNFPAVKVVKPSTSFSSEMYSVTFSPLIPCIESSGSCNIIPCTEQSALSSASLLTKSRSEISLEGNDISLEYIFSMAERGKSRYRLIGVILRISFWVDK